MLFPHLNDMLVATGNDNAIFDFEVKFFFVLTRQRNILFYLGSDRREDSLTFVFLKFFLCEGEIFLILALHLTESTEMSIVWSMIDFWWHKHVAIAPSACFLLLGITGWTFRMTNDQRPMKKTLLLF